MRALDHRLSKGLCISDPDRSLIELYVELVTNSGPVAL
jgi:hypothetical protein